MGPLCVLTGTIAGLVFVHERCGTRTGTQLSRSGYGPATVPAIPLHWNIRSDYGPETLPVRLGTVDFNEDVPVRTRNGPATVTVSDV